MPDRIGTSEQRKMKGEYEDIMYYRKGIKGRQVRVESPFGGAAAGGGAVTEHGIRKMRRGQFEVKKLL